MLSLGKILFYIKILFKGSIYAGNHEPRAIKVMLPFDAYSRMLPTENGCFHVCLNLRRHCFLQRSFI